MAWTATPNHLEEQHLLALVYPSANTTPWQIEGVTRKLQKDGWKDLAVVENRTVVTKAKGRRLNHFVGVHERYGLPVRYNFDPEICGGSLMDKADVGLDKVFPKGIRPGYFFA